jgi:hypothetical protein
MFGAMTARTTKGNLKNGTESKKETTPKAPKVKAKARTEQAAKPAKTAKRAKEPADRLPATVEELKAGKAGLATYLFLSGKGKDEIAAELKSAFKLSATQAAKIVRRIVGRARFFQRALSLVTAK